MSKPYMDMSALKENPRKPGAQNTMQNMSMNNHIPPATPVVDVTDTPAGGMPSSRPYRDAEAVKPVPVAEPVAVTVTPKPARWTTSDVVGGAVAGAVAMGLALLAYKQYTTNTALTSPVPAVSQTLPDLSPVRPAAPGCEKQTRVQQANSNEMVVKKEAVPCPTPSPTLINAPLPSPVPAPQRGSLKDTLPVVQAPVQADTPDYMSTKELYRRAASIRAQREAARDYLEEEDRYYSARYAYRAPYYRDYGRGWGWSSTRVIRKERWDNRRYDRPRRHSGHKHRHWHGGGKHHGGHGHGGKGGGHGGSPDRGGGYQK